MKNKPYPYYDVPKIKNLQDLLRFCLETYGEKIAFKYMQNKEEINKSYQNFFEDVAALCSFFIESGYSRTHIAILGENSYEWLVTFFAIVNSNNVVVTLDKELTAQDISNIVKRSDSTVLVHSDDYYDEAKINENVVLINMKDIAEIINKNKTKKCKEPYFYESTKIDDKAMCAIFYTSGTTSEPKGVMLSHKNIALDTIYIGMNSDIPDSSLLVLPLQHTYAIIMAVTLPLLKGCSVFINNSMRNLVSDMQQCKPKYMAVVPMMMEVFYKKINDGLKNSDKEKTIEVLLKISKILCTLGIDLRKLFFSKIVESFGGQLELIAVGGAPINKNTIAALTAFGIQALGGYGTTECSPIISSVRNKHYKPDSVGYVVPNVEARIIDNEIQIKGDIVFSGYYKDEDATKLVFDGEWYKTGDIGFIEDGFLYIKGRCKNMIVLSNGENVSPESIEVLIQDKIPEIEEVLVFGEDDIITAEVYVSSDGDLIREKILMDIENVNKELPAYKRIANVIFRQDEFEKTTTKKIKRDNK